MCEEPLQKVTHTMTVVVFVLLWCGILGAFFFAGVETGFVSWNPLKVSFRARQGNVNARWALHLLNNKERVLSTVLIGNNTCVVIASLSFLYLFIRLNQLVTINLDIIPSPETWFLSPVLVIFSEMLPKSLFRIYSFRLTMRSIPILIVLYWVTLPVTWIFSLLGKLFQKKLEKGEAFITNVRKEMVLLAQEGSKRGTLFEYATIFIDNILKLKYKTVGSITQSESRFLKETDSDTSKEHVINVTDNVLDICQGEYFADRDNTLVFDKNGQKAVGWITLLDIAKAENKTKIGVIIRPLPEIDKDTSLLRCFSREVNFLNPYYRIIDKKGDTGLVLNRFDVFRLIFRDYSSF